ncbi:MAG: ANTAR domain-containing response regulator [Lachnospiraceae bacterium]
MTNIIVVFSKAEDARSVRSVLVRNGYSVKGVCTTGSQAIQYADELQNGLIVCGYRLGDMLYSELRGYVGMEFEMLVVTSKMHVGECEAEGISCVAMPLKVHELLSKVEVEVEICEHRKRRRRMQPRQRSEQDTKILNEAKELLMKKNHMTESEAHRYIQKVSMDSGNNLIETAQMILTLSNR